MQAKFLKFLSVKMLYKLCKTSNLVAKIKQYHYYWFAEWSYFEYFRPALEPWFVLRALKQMVPPHYGWPASMVRLEWLPGQLWLQQYLRKNHKNHATNFQISILKCAIWDLINLSITGSPFLNSSFFNCLEILKINTKTIIVFFIWW